MSCTPSRVECGKEKPNDGVGLSVCILFLRLRNDEQVDVGWANLIGRQRVLTDTPNR